MATFDYYDDVYQPGYGTDALIAQDYKLKQREAALMEQMKASAAQIGVQPQGQMVSGYYVPPSKTQALAPLVQQIANQVQEKKLTDDRSGYRALEAQAVNNHLAQMPGDEEPIQAKLKWAQAGARIPALRSQMTDYAKDLLIKEPDRIAALQDRKDARAEARTAAKEKQDAELSYRRERDSDRLADNQANRDLRATIAAAVRAHSGSGGGDKASNYQLLTDDEGNVTRVNKLTGESQPVAAKAGKSAGIVLKDSFDKKERRENASKALEDLDKAETLLKTATGSKVGSLRDTIMGAAGYATDGAKSAAALEPIANSIVSNIPRMAGQVSDADLLFLKKQGGDLANKELPVETRLAALREVRRVMRRASNEGVDGGERPESASNAPSIRQSIEQAMKERAAPTRLKFNPATGRLE